MIAPGVIAAVTILVGLTALALAGFVAGTKAVRTLRARSMAAAVAPHRAALLTVASGEDDDGASAAHLTAVSAQEWKRVAPSAIALLSKVRGSPAEDLAQLLRRHGDLDAALRQLRSRSAVRRARGAYLLGLVRDRTHSGHLLPLLSDPSAEVRLVTVRALGAIGDPALAADVLATLRTRRGQAPLPAHVGAEALLSMGAGTGAALRDAMSSDDSLVRDVAAVVAGHVNLISAAPRLREMLRADPELQVRMSAAQALGLVGTAHDVPALAATASDAAAPVRLRRSCADALGGIGHPDGAPPLAALLDAPDRRLAQIAAEALTRLGRTGLDHLSRVPPSGPAGRAARAALATAARRATSAGDA